MKILNNLFFSETQKRISKRILLFTFLAFVSSFTLFGQAPAGYYDGANAKTGAELKTALYNIIKGHTDKGYDGLYAVYTTSDNLPSGKVWDMYSIKADGTASYWYSHTSGDRCGSYSGEGDCYNREHTFCDSWLGNASPQRSDAHHVVPTDGYVNNRRSSYPHGKVGSVTWTSTNGSKLGGSASSTGYSGTVFEPIDEFKGDFARIYFYMATRYENLIAGWVNNGSASAILAGNSYPAYKTWFINLMLQWHNQDPISQKEVDRNNAIYALQHNRNPFIDRPEYAEMIWGDGTVSVAFTSTPPTSVQAGASYNYGITVTGKPGATFTITAPTKPNWLTLTSTGNGTATLTGTPLEANVGNNSVVLRATDGTTTKDQNFTLNVISANQPLQFTSTPITTGQVGVSYSYNVTLTGNSGATFTITATTKPSWLTITSTGNGTATLSGTPSSGNVGSNTIVLKGTDGTSNVEQSFAINVTEVGTGNSFVETFEKMPTTSSSYLDRNWIGDNNISWTAIVARTDETINGRAICLKNQTSTLPYLQSQIINGGCSQIKFKHQQKYSGSGGIAKLFINNVEVGSVNVTTTPQTSTFSVTGVSGDFVIKFESNGLTRIAIDDVEWQNATTTPNENPEIVAVTTNPITPFTGQIISISAEVDDADGTIQAVSMQWGLSSGNLANTVSMTASGGLYVAQIPAQNSPTTIHYKITATDNLGGTVSFIGSFNIVVNNAPTISNVSQNPSNPTSANTTIVSCQVSDTENNLSSVNLLWGLATNNLNNTVVMNSSSNLFSGTIPAQTGGTTVFYTIKAKDSENLETQSSTFSYVVENASTNSKPTISNIQLNPQNPVTGQSINLSASISDSDGTIKKVIMGWGKESANENLVEVTSGSSIYGTTIPSQNSVGTVYFKIYAIDNLDDTTKYNSSLSVGVNNLPSITNIDQDPSNPTFSEDVTVSANVIDPENRLQSVILEWGLTESTLQNELVMTNSLSKYSTKIPKQAEGVTVYYRIIAKDAENYQNQSSVLNYKVQIENKLPTISNVTINPSAPITGQSISITSDVTDIDGSVVKVLLNWGSNSTLQENSVEMIPSGNNYLTIIPAQTQAKTIYFKISAIDNSEDTSYYNQSINIAANQLPFISNITQSPTNPTSSDNVGITAQVVDPEGRLGAVFILWGSASNSLSSQVTMTSSNSTLSGSIPAQVTGSNIFYRIKAFDAEGNQAYSDILNYTVSASSGIGDNNMSSIKVYPNPFRESLNVDVENPGNTTVVIMDIIGKVLHTTEFAEKSQPINTNSLKSGIYIVKVVNGGRTSIIRVVKR